MFNLGVGAAHAVAPALLTALCLGVGSLGWLVAGAWFALCAAVIAFLRPGVPSYDKS